LQLGRQGSGIDDVRHGEPPAGPEDAKGFAEGLFLVGDEIDHAIRDHDIGCVVGNRQVFEFAEAEFDIARANAGCVVTRLFQHLIGHVDADDMTGRANPLRRQKTVEAGTAAEVDDCLAGLQGGNCQRIAAAEPKVDALGDCG
jgi:hypothetical protein